MKVVAYNIYSTAAWGVALNAGQVDIQKNGKLVAWSVSWNLLGGAAAGAQNLQILKNASAGSTFATASGVQRETNIGYVHLVTPITTYAVVNHAVSGLAIPVQLGDRIFIGCANAGGTVATAGVATVTLYVAED